MPFGMTNSRETFNRVMPKLLSGDKNADNYGDDILGYTTARSEHIRL